MSSCEPSRDGLVRSSLACLACRVAKSKCDGLIPSALSVPMRSPNEEGASTSGARSPRKSPRPSDHRMSAFTAAVVRAEVRCSRCARLELECEWRPCQRSGRPPGKQRRLETARGVGERTTVGDGEGSVVGSLARDDSALHADMAVGIGELQHPNHLDQTPSADTTLEMLDIMSHFLDQGESYPVPPFTSQACALVGETPSPAHSQYELLRRRVGTTVQAGIAAQRTDNRDDVRWHNEATIETGIQRYFDGLGLAIPVVVEASSLLVHESLAFATAAMGHILFEGADGPAYLDARSRCLQRIHARPEEPSQSPSSGAMPSRSTELLAHLLALILMIYADFGAHDFALATLHLQMACQAALRCDLHKIDRSAAVSSAADAAFLEACRQVWWELWILDSVLDIASSGQIVRNLANVHAEVNTPFGGKESSEEKVWSIRIRTVSLLRTAVTPPRGAGIDVARLRKADIVHSYVIAEAQMLYLSVARARRTSSRESMQQDRVLYRQETVLFDCLMMLYAGRIHLHRMAWFADLTLDLHSCSFRAKASDSADGDGRCALQQADLGATYAGQMQDSIGKILQSASLILQFTQLDSDAFFRRSLQHSGDMPFAAPHWPLIGCCQMVASYGFVVGAALDNRAHTSIATSVGATAHYSQSVVLSSDELYVASACSTDGEGVDTLRESEQAAGSIALAEATLGALSDVWKVAALYRSEVHQCRLAVDCCESPQEFPLWLQ